MVSALPQIALQAGGNRVVKGVKIEHVCGDPALGQAGDAELRRRIVERCLEAIRTPVSSPTLFRVEQSEGVRQ
jgi:glycine/betaine/sarcosine/D-proline reductase family selenoprotein B